MPKPRPTRATTDGRAYLDLQNLARRQGRPTDELHQLYTLEGFLSRLTASADADRFVLKGGVLLAAYGDRRPTRDIDLFARDLSNAPEEMLACMRPIAAIQLDDGLTFEPESASVELIRDDADYSGVRVNLTASLSIAKLSFHIDINVGDSVWPAPGPVVLPLILGGELTITGYPLSMVYAEKIITMLQRRAANTRWRDFADVYSLSCTRPVDGSQLHHSLTTVATHRQVTITPLSSALAGMAELAQARWTAWRRKQRLEQRIPEQFASVLQHVAEFGDPAITGTAKDMTWDPAILAWTRNDDPSAAPDSRVPG